VTPAAARGYLSFTSGTTGQPKAVDSGEAPLIHFLNWYRTTFRLGREDRFAMLNNVSHDPVLRDIFTPLTCSGSLTVPDPALLRDPRGLLTWLDDRGITVAHMTPQLVRMMAAGPERPRAAGSLRLVAVAGDQLTEADVAALRRFAPRARLLNFYGTTETPQAQAYHEICGPTPAAGQDVLPEPRAMLVPVGAGIDAAQLLVMSVCGRPAAVGELGEVVIRSRYLSRGYLDRDLDGERFGPLPGAGQGRTYRTGDLGRYGPSGAVTLAGRADDQVKVRGFRVELGEVEAVLRTHPEVTHAAVRLFEHDGFSALHAYVTATAPVIVESDVLRHVRSRLPAYAVPSSVMLLPALPLTVSGKVDRRMLPPPRSALRAGPTADDGPSGEIERLILAIWRDVLGLARIAVNDSFFEIGGHSIAIIAVQARLQRALGRPVPVVDLFRFPTIHSLGRYLAGRDTRADLLDADARGRLRRQRAGRSRAHSRRGDMDQ
jgi:acyl-coenzyme A synthetase/AMP-(fatty) acid ligase